MLPLRYARQWRSSSVVLLLFVLLIALMPAVWFWPDRAGLIKWLAAFDKWAHGITFVLLALWFAGQYRPRSYWRIAAGLLMFGVLIEICQRFVSYRTAEWFDVAADAAGIMIGLAIAMMGIGGWCLHVENWYSKRRTGVGVD